MLSWQIGCSPVHSALFRSAGPVVAKPHLGGYRYDRRAAWPRLSRDGRTPRTPPQPSHVPCSRVALQLEILALRHELQVLERDESASAGLIGSSSAGSLALGRWAGRPGHRETGDGHRVASPRLPRVLALDESTSWRSARRAGGPAGVDSVDVRGESAVGRRASTANC